MEAWQLRRNVLRRDLRSAARDLRAIAEKRAAAVLKRRAGTKFRPLSNREAEALIGADLLAAVAACAQRS